MSRRAIRPVFTSILAAIVCFAVSASTGATGDVGPIVDRLVAHAVTMTSAGPEVDARIDIVIERWSSEAQGNLLRSTIDSGAPTLLAALQTVQRRAGFVLSPGVQGTGARARGRRARNIQFAREINTPAGRQIIIATDQYLGFGEPRRLARTLHDQEFSLIDIRFDANGLGVGKVAPASDVTYNTAKKTIELDNFGRLPERLSNVRSEPWPQKY
jgi:hypothetical protein